MRVLLPVVLLLVAGCLNPGATLDPALLTGSLAGEDGSPLALVLLEGVDAAGETVWLASTDLDGAMPSSLGGAARVLAWVEGAAFEVGQGGALSPAALTRAPPVSFAVPVALPNPAFPLQLGTTCLEKTDGDAGCGLDEPSIVVDATGRVFYTAACCFLVSSPVFVSEDEGASFRPLRHPVKDAYGNEGDLAIDDAGNVYYADIDLATFGIARWDADLQPQQAYRRPGEPLVDRPWIRAGSGGTVHLVYNTGTDTVHYLSTDHAMTFTPTPVARFGSALAGAYTDVRSGVVGMVGYGEFMESTDGGRTWGERTPVEGCGDAEGGAYEREGVAIDEAGTRWHLVGECVVPRSADGAWGAPSQAFPEGLETFMLWHAAGAPGAVAVAAYARPAGEEDWRVYVALTMDGGAHWATLVADPQPVGTGDLGRRLGDFLSVALGPDGAVHVAYATNPEMDDSATATYVRTTPFPGLAPSQPLMGPFG